MDTSPTTHTPEIATGSARAARRNLIIVRGGDDSLHSTWLTPGVERNWDLHVSYFGAKDAPTGAEAGQFTWTKDGGTSKWTGLDICLSKRPFNVDDYDFVATPDDDLAASASTWNRAFNVAAQHDLAISQLSLDPRSFYTFGVTLQRPGFLLRYVDAVEFMPPIFRRDAFARFIPLLPEPDNAWGVEYVMASYYRDNPRALAVIDAAAVLHTREHGVSALYKHFQKTGKTMEEIEQGYLSRYGVEKFVRRALGAIDVRGEEVTDLRAIRRPVLSARLLKSYRKFRHIERVAPRGS